MIKAGTLITCPTCKTALMEASRDIHRGERVDASQFKAWAQEAKNGHPLACNKCNEAIFKNGSIHTTEGWVS